MQNQLSNKRWLRLCFGFIILSLGLSPITTQLLPSLGNVIEPFVLFGIFVINRNSPFKIPFVRVFKSKPSIYGMFFLIIMAVVGLLTPQGSITMGNVYTNIYADFRACYIFFYIFLLLLNRGWNSEQKAFFLKWLVWPIIMWGFIYSYRVLGDNTEEGGRTLGLPVHFLLIQTFLYHKSGNYLVHFVLLAIGMYYAVFALARINIFLFVIQALVVALPLFLSKAESAKQALMKLVAAGLLVFLLCKVVPMAYDFYLSSEGGKAQIERITGAVNSTGEAEGERTKSLYVPFTDAEFFLLPEGLGWRNHVYKIGHHYHYEILSTQDSCWLYLYYHFGLLGGLFFSFLLLDYLMKCVKKFRVINMEDSEKVLMGIAFAMCFLTQGVFFTVPQSALAGGGNVIAFVECDNLQDKASSLKELVENHSHEAVLSIAA